MLSFADLPYGATVVVPTYAHVAGEPQILGHVFVDQVLELPVQDIPEGRRVFVAGMMAPGQTFDAVQYTEQVWSQEYHRALAEAARSRIEAEPARSWIEPEPLPEVWIGNDTLPGSAYLVVPTKARYAQQEPRFVTTLRVVSQGVVSRTTVPWTTIPTGSVVWVSACYSASNGEVPDSTRFIPTRWDERLRLDLSRDMTNRTEPEVGAWTLSWDRIPPRRTWAQVAMLGVPSAVLALGGIPWGMAFLSVIGFFGLVYAAFWALQTEPDHYERRRRVDIGRMVLSGAAGALSARSAARDGTVGAAARTAASAAVLGLSVDSYVEHAREQRDRVR